MIKFEIQFKDKANDSMTVTLTATESEKRMCAMVKHELTNLLKNINK